MRRRAYLDLSLLKKCISSAAKRQASAKEGDEY